MFVDKVQVNLVAGKGGNGFVSFRREKYVDRGGPDGGDGGDGGDIVVVASDRENTLAAFRYKKEIQAEAGDGGFKRKQHGRSAKPLELNLPVGTSVFDDQGNLLADLVNKDEKVVIAKGGKGGFGNAHFVSSRRQAPKVAEKGEPGEVVPVTFELKMIADTGLVGLPNAGKSTLLSRISNAHPEIANYPFTTLVPHLGVVDIDKKNSLLVADIPGLIEGASKGKGLGDEFLRHVERTKVLIHLIDAYSEDIVSAYKTIQSELKAYKVDLSKRPQLIVLNKIDGLPKDMIDDSLGLLKKAAPRGAKLFAISAQSGQGVDELLFATLELVKKASTVPKKLAKKPELPVITLKSTADRWSIIAVKKGYIIRGEKIERFANRTDFDNPAGVQRLRDIMRKMGIMHELERKKIDPGNRIQFADNKDQTIEY